MAASVQMVLIIVSSNLIIQSNTLSDDTQNQYPAGILACKTHNLTEMDCSFRFLTDIPFVNLTSTTTLDLSHNQLTEIKGAPFKQLPLLRLSNLSSNEISHLSSTAFQGLWFLEQLDLGFNQIEVLPSGIFFNLSKLEYINMLNDWIYTIPNETMELQALHEICLSIGGNSSEIGKIGFCKSNLTTLRYLALLTSNIRNDTFQYFYNLPLWSFHTRTRSVWVNRRYRSHAACELHTLPISRRWGKRSGFCTFCWSRRQLWLK